MQPDKQLDNLSERILRFAKPSANPGVEGVSLPTEGGTCGYLGIEYAKRLDFKVGKKWRSFLVFTYRAYSAYGLVGTENNGIGIANVDQPCVVCGGIARMPSGWGGMNDIQVHKFNEICALAWPEFDALVARHR